MSVDLLRDSLDGTEVIWQRAIATEEFYWRCWNRGVQENKIRFFKESAEFYASDLSEVINELQRLQDWASEALSPVDAKRMLYRIDTLLYWLPRECENEGGKFFLA